MKWSSRNQREEMCTSLRRMHRVLGHTTTCPSTEDSSEEPFVCWTYREMRSNMSEACLELGKTGLDKMWYI